jgi:hypothetical protein
VVQVEHSFGALALGSNINFVIKGMIDQQVTRTSNFVDYLSSWETLSLGFVEIGSIWIRWKNVVGFGANKVSLRFRHCARSRKMHIDSFCCSKDFICEVPPESFVREFCCGPLF